MKQHKRLTKIIFSIVAITVLVATAGCAFAGGAPRPNGGTPGGVDSGEVTPVTIVDNVEASGTVKAAQDALLTWKTSGVIDQVNVKAGDTVKEGDVLATLVLTSVPASVLSAQADLINSQKTVEDLTPTALAISQAAQKVALAIDDVHNKQRIADGLGTPASQADIDQADATVLLAKIKLDKAWDKYKPYQNKSDTSQIKAYFYNQWAQAQQQYDQAVRRLNNLKGVTVNKTDLELAKANLELSKVTLADAQKKLEDLKAGADAQDVAAAEARITAAQATLSALSLTAPFDGEILVADLLPGDVVNSGQTAFTIADRSQLHVDTLIDETDIASVKIGDKVTLTMDSIPGVSLTGVVDFINPMGQTVSGNVKYPVRIALDNIDQPILLEATADVRIETGTPRNLLTVPVRAIQSDAQGEFVNLVGPDGALTRIDVVSGQLQGDRVVILSGELKESDRVELVAATNEMLDRMNSMGQ